MTPAPKKPWFELSRYERYADLFMIVGGLSIVGAVAYWSIPAGVVLFGAGMLSLSWLMSR